MDHILTGIYSNIEFLQLANGIEDKSNISAEVLDLIRNIKQLFSYANEKEETVSVYKLFEPRITEHLKTLTATVKAGNSSLKPILNDLKVIILKFRDSLTDPSLAAPVEYKTLFEKLVAMVQLILRTMENSVENPERVQEDVVQVVVQLKEILAYYTQYPVLKEYLEDRKPAFLAHLTRLVKDSQQINGSHSSLENREYYIRTLVALADMLNDWFGNKFALSLQKPLAVLQKAKTRDLQRLVELSPQTKIQENQNYIADIDETEHFDGSNLNEQNIRNSINEETNDVNNDNCESILARQSTRNSVPWDEKYCNAETLKEYRGLFFAVAVRDFDASSIQSKVETLSFNKSDIIVVIEDSSPDSWKGGNTSTKKIGYFPRHFVEVIAESFQFIKSYDDFDPLESLQQAEDQNSLSKDHRIKGIVLAGENKNWTSATLELKNLKLTISTSKTLSGTLRKKKKNEILFPVFLSLPNCSISPVYTPALDKKYGDRSIQIIDKTTNIAYKVALDGISNRTNWTRILTLASLETEKTVDSEVMEEKEIKEKEQQVRPRSMSLFSSRRTSVSHKKSLSKDTKITQPSSPLTKTFSTSDPNLLNSIEKSEKVEKVENTSPVSQEKEKMKRRGSVFGKLRARSGTIG